MSATLDEWRENKRSENSAQTVYQVFVVHSWSQAFQIKVLTAFLEVGEAFLLGQSAASAGRLTRRTGQFIEATQRAEL